ncbi:hypothetical protein I5E97_16155 [Proteus hauseri]|nr:hypothetical protein [Proteus hauseri]
MARWLKDNKEISVKIEPVYMENNDRPAKINVRYTIEGERSVIKSFTNFQRGN